MTNLVNELLKSKRAVLTSIRRFEQSPYLSCYDKPGIVSGVYAGRFFPLNYGDDPVEKYWTLRRKAVLYDVPERPVEIAGPDVVAFLEYVFARNISTLKQDRGRYAIACTPKGGVFMDGILFKMDQNRYWYVQPDGALETWLIAHSKGFDITVSDPKSRVLQIQGPASMKIMHAASDGAIDEKLKYFHSGLFDLGGQTLYVSRTGFTGELGYEIYSFGLARDVNDDEFVGYSSPSKPETPVFYLTLPINKQPATFGNGTMIALVAASREMVDQFHAVGLASGGTDEGKPGPRPADGTSYYAYIRDPDGNKICAYCD